MYFFFIKKIQNENRIDEMMNATHRSRLISGNESLRKAR